jgi:baseplate J-like protein
MADLIPAPDLEIRDEEQLAAEAIGRTSGGLTVSLVESQIEERRRLLDLLLAGALTDPPICPELTNANPSAPHTVGLEAQGWMLAQMAYRINQFPKRDQIEFARLFKRELRAAEPAETMLEFSVAPPDGVDVTVPIGTQVSTDDDGKIVFETTEDLVIPFGAATAQVTGHARLAGALLLAPAQLTKMVDPVAWVDSVTNPDAIDGGGNDESIEEALERARNYQQRAERLVTTRDLELAVREDVLRGNGIVRGFPFIAAGEFNAAVKRPGHTTLVVMTRNGNPVSADAKKVINSVLETAVGNQFIYISDPIYVPFNVSANVLLLASAPELATLEAIEANLRDFYAPKRERFGRKISRAEIITVIEDTAGVDRIEAQQQGGAILASPLADVKLEPWQLPQLVTVTLNAV